MLTVHCVQNIRDKERLFESVGPRDVSWIVSDLQSKLEIQERMLDRSSFIEDEQVLRASELWFQIYRRLQPQVRCISMELASVLVHEWMSKLDLPFARSKDSQKTLFVYLEQLLPVLAHDHGQELLEQWLDDHSESQIRWRSWYELAKWTWSEFQEHQLMPRSLVKAALSNCSVARVQLDKRTVFDLGSALSPIEVELISELARSNEVVLVRPIGKWIQSFPVVEACYERMEKQ
jgi:hypothetical protein